MKNIHILWPTVRPVVCRNSLIEWLNNADNSDGIKIHIAVNTQHQMDELELWSNRSKLIKDNLVDVYIIGEERRGVTKAAYSLTRSLTAFADDLIILASDDFYAHRGWDSWVLKHFEDYSGGLVVNDGYQPGQCVTIPIIDFNTLLILNKIIYHPNYYHQYSDAELYANLDQLGLLKDIRHEDVMFEHKHWANNKRTYDDADLESNKTSHIDCETFEKRMQMNVQDRLSI